VGDNGTINHWNGSSWSRVASPTNDDLRGVWGSATDVFVVGGFSLGYDSGHHPTIVRYRR
jgi:hypothetical protein